MTTTTARPVVRRAQAAVFRVLNVPMRLLLGLPFATPAGRRLMLVNHTGRRTGRHYKQPVSYIEAEGTLLTPGGGRWTRNLRDGEPVNIRLKGRDVTFTPELVADLDQVERLLAVMSKATPTVKRFVRIPSDTNGRLDRNALSAAVEHGFRVVRWHRERGDNG